jgi:hypothetical protein
MAVYLGIVAILAMLSAQRNQGHLIYTFDDAYIHMSMAKNFALYGVWGVTREGFTSSSSSPLWTLLLAGFLASDHLAEPLADGSASLVLARPVGRSSFALARLAGALAIALVSGAVLLGGAGVLLHLRQGLAWLPLFGAFAAMAAGAATVGAFAMAASLALPRIATLLLLLMSVGMIAALNLAALSGAQLGGLTGVIEGYGPPLVSSVAFALREWVAPSSMPGNALALALRHGVWTLASAALLVLAFRRTEIE